MSDNCCALKGFSQVSKDYKTSLSFLWIGLSGVASVSENGVEFLLKQRKIKLLLTADKVLYSSSFSKAPTLIILL